MLLAALMLWAMHPPVAVEGQGDCPAALEVSRRLGELMAAVPDDVAPDRASLRQDVVGLHVDLRRDDGTPIAERLLPPSSSCAALASASAVVIATWEAQLRPQQPPRLPSASVTTTSAAPPPPGSAVDLEVGAIASVAGGDWEAGGLVAVSWAPPPGRLGIHLGLAVATTRSIPANVVQGAVDWTRGSVVLGPRYRVEGRLARLDVHVGGLVGVTNISGRGLEMTHSDTIGQLGVGAGVHLAPAWNPAPWIGVEAQFWPAREGLAIENAPQQPDLPRFELQLAAGIALGRY